MLEFVDELRTLKEKRNSQVASLNQQTAAMDKLLVEIEETNRLIQEKEESITWNSIMDRVAQLPWRVVLVGPAKCVCTAADGVDFAVHLGPYSYCVNTEIYIRAVDGQLTLTASSPEILLAWAEETKATIDFDVLVKHLIKRANRSQDIISKIKALSPE
jgi:hypothetical protein